MEKPNTYYTELEWLEWENEFMLSTLEKVEGDEIKFEIQDDSVIIISKVEE